jgi:hypothetical protein
MTVFAANSNDCSNGVTKREVQPDDVADLRLQLRVRAELERLQAVGLDAPLPLRPGHGRERDAQLRGQEPGRPVGDPQPLRRPPVISQRRRDDVARHPLKRRPEPLITGGPRKHVPDSKVPSHRNSTGTGALTDDTLWHCALLRSSLVEPCAPSMRLLRGVRRPGSASPGRIAAARDDA